jgi:hypothetical protein
VLDYILGERSPGAYVVDFIYRKQIKGKGKWFPKIGEVSGYVWMLVFNIFIWFLLLVSVTTVIGLICLGVTK